MIPTCFLLRPAHRTKIASRWPYFSCYSRSHLSHHTSTSKEGQVFDEQHGGTRSTRVTCALEEEGHDLRDHRGGLPVFSFFSRRHCWMSFTDVLQLVNKKDMSHPRFLRLGGRTDVCNKMVNTSDSAICVRGNVVDIAETNLYRSIRFSQQRQVQ